jgi:hypothetical protein
MTLILKPKRYTTTKIKEFQADLLDEHRGKNPQKDNAKRIQQHIKKIIHHDQDIFIVGMQT